MGKNTDNDMEDGVCYTAGVSGIISHLMLLDCPLVLHVVFLQIQLPEAWPSFGSAGGSDRPADKDFHQRRPCGLCAMILAHTQTDWDNDEDPEYISVSNVAGLPGALMQNLRDIL